MTHKLLVVTTTTSSESEAQAIADHLLQQRLAACVQIEGPIESVYRWQGQIQRDSEWRLCIKTTNSRYEQLSQAVLSLHSYDQPQLIATSVAETTEGYAQWVIDSVASD